MLKVGNSPASEFYELTFSNTLSVPSSLAGWYLPAYEDILCENWGCQCWCQGFRFLGCYCEWYGDWLFMFWKRYIPSNCLESIRMLLSVPTQEIWTIVILHNQYFSLPTWLEFIPWRTWLVHFESDDPVKFTAFSNIFCADDIRALRRGTWAGRQTCNLNYLRNVTNK